jgi:hypothetical protein
MNCCNFSVVSVHTFYMFRDGERANRFFSAVHVLLADGRSEQAAAEVLPGSSATAAGERRPGSEQA